MRRLPVLLCLLCTLLRAAGTIPPAPDTEPSVSEEEAAILNQAIEQAQTNPAAAARFLRQSGTEESSAAIEFAEAVYWLDAGQTGDALDALRRSLEKHPRFHRARFNLAKLHMRADDYPAAVRELQTLLGSDTPDRAEAWRLLAYALRETRQLAAAETAYRKAIVFYPEDRSLRLALLGCLIEQERFAEAIPWARQELANEPGNRDFWGLLINAELATDRREKALLLLECARRLGAADGPMLALLGDLYLDQNLPEPALECYRQAAALEQAPAGRLLDGFAALVLARHLDEAARLDEVLNPRQDQFTPGQRLRYRALRAGLAAATERTGEAIRQYRQVLEEDPIHGDALLALGELLINSQPEEARELFTRAARLDAHQIQAWIALARLAVEQDDLPAAAAWVQRALERRPDQALERYLAQIRAAMP